MDHDLLGPAIRQAWQQGYEQGFPEDVENGLCEGGLRIVRRQATHLFGPIPEWAEERLETLSFGEIETVAPCLLHAKTSKTCR